MTPTLLTERETVLLARRADIIEIGGGVLLTDRARAKLIRDADNMLVADYANRLSRLAAELRAVRADNERLRGIEYAAGKLLFDPAVRFDTGLALLRAACGASAAPGEDA